MSWAILLTLMAQLACLLPATPLRVPTLPPGDARATNRLRETVQLILQRRVWSRRGSPTGTHSRRPSRPPICPQLVPLAGRPVRLLQSVVGDARTANRSCGRPLGLLDRRCPDRVIGALAPPVPGDALQPVDNGHRSDEGGQGYPRSVACVRWKPPNTSTLSGIAPQRSWSRHGPASMLRCQAVLVGRSQISLPT